MVEKERKEERMKKGEEEGKKIKKGKGKGRKQHTTQQQRKKTK